MPTYDYECLACKHRFEVFQSMKDEPVQFCVKCNGKVRKLFANTGIIFKGSGFYVNDYKKNSTANDKAGKKSKDSEKSSCAASESCSSAGCSKGATE
jgi:putative FmdB family regulatory protein